MKRIYCLLSLIFIFSITIHAQPITWNWAKTHGGIGSSDGNMGITRDPAGNTYVIGDFSGTKTFGTFSLTSIGFNEIYVVKYDPTGIIQWAIRAGGSFSASYAGGISYSGNELYVAGKFSNIINCGGISQPSFGLSDVFLIKLNPSDGTTVWVQNAGGANDDKAIGIDAAAGGGVFLCGAFSGTSTFGTINLNTSGSFDQDIFVAKYNTDGTCAWAVKAGGTSVEEAVAVRKDLSGSVFVTGAFTGSATFGTGTVLTSTNTNNDVFVAKYNGSNGSLLWAQKAGGKGNDNGRGLGIDNSGNAYVCGFISDTATFGAFTIYDNNAGDFFLAKYSPSGTVLWAMDEGGNLYDIANGSSTDHLGGTYVTGFITGNANFSGTNVTGANDAFLAKYDLSGNLKWVTKVGTGAYEYGVAVLADSNGFCNVAGLYFGTTTIGTTTLSSPSEYSCYYARMGGGTVGINEIDNLNFSIYPNPANEFISIDLSQIKDLVFTVEVLAVDGKVMTTSVISHEMTNTPHSINLNKFPSGNYIFRVNSSQGEFSKPFIINR
jgi:hypothetical protein